MNKIVTHENLIRYAYNETELTESAVLQIAIDEDRKVADTFDEIVNCLSWLDKHLLEPSDNTVSKIMAVA